MMPLLFPYAVATAAGAISPYITLVICGLVAAFYALPGTTRGTPEDAPSAASSP
jgi:hypothetical protein